MNGATLVFDKVLSPFLSCGKLDSLRRFLNGFCACVVVVVCSLFKLDVMHSSSNLVQIALCAGVKKRKLGRRQVINIYPEKSHQSLQSRCMVIDNCTYERSISGYKHV